MVANRSSQADRTRQTHPELLPPYPERNFYPSIRVLSDPLRCTEIERSMFREGAMLEWRKRSDHLKRKVLVPLLLAKFEPKAAFST